MIAKNDIDNLYVSEEEDSDTVAFTVSSAVPFGRYLKHEDDFIQVFCCFAKGTERLTGITIFSMGRSSGRREIKDIPLSVLSDCDRKFVKEFALDALRKEREECLCSMRM